MMSGPRVDKFKSGWAVRIFGFAAAHFYTRREAGAARPLCGQRDVLPGYLLEAGTWKRCRRCEQKLEQKA
jgi:hypothetical protein